MKRPELTPISGVSRETHDRLEAYHALLLKWQDKINLISPNTVPDAWSRHFVDSAQIGKLLVNKMPRSLYDLGAGAGFPGMVMATMFPEVAVTLIESDAKKCAFLQTVSRETGVAVTIVNQRIEEASRTLPAPDMVTARALSALGDLLDYCRPWLEKRSDLVFIFPKGASALEEIKAAEGLGWAFDCRAIQSQTDKSARILLLENVRKA